jgi:hypothetical protein
MEPIYFKIQKKATASNKIAGFISIQLQTFIAIWPILVTYRSKDYDFLSNKISFSGDLNNLLKYFCFNTIMILLFINLACYSFI